MHAKALLERQAAAVLYRLPRAADDCPPGGRPNDGHPLPDRLQNLCPPRVRPPDVRARFVDAPTIAAMLSVSRRSLRRMVVKGEFPPADLVLSQTLLRWKVETVENWIDEHATGEAGK